MTDEMMLPILQPNKLLVTEFHDRVRYDYYLVGQIGNPDEYVDVCHALRTCTPSDDFFFRINSEGGQVRSGNMIINAIHECQGTVFGFIEGNCGSMATFVFLACHTWGVSKYAEFFCHTVSSGNFGKEPETFEAAQFLRKQTHKRIREEYNSFLTPEEIDSVLKGSDIYLDCDEIMERLEVYADSRGAEYEVEEGHVPKTIEQMMEDAVRNVLKEQQEKDVEQVKRPARKAPAKKSADKVVDKPSPEA